MPIYEYIKSSYSSAANECVEVARNVPGTVAVRDSKHPAGPVLRVTPGAWRALTAYVRRAA
ncbi:DUF397 domain-containing protein [Streptomyces sp. NBC_01506]|uniref:DUF397 domain-containing protein n=1 Tax=Streptomyces sp. NBC_01506 TaxID=2903887 RepID=UPI00386F3BED